MSEAAEVVIKAKGADEAAAEIRKLKGSFKEVGEAAKESGGVGKQAWEGIKGAVSGVLSDMGRVLTVANTISFAHARESAVSFEAATTRMGIATGQTYDALKGKIYDVSKATGELPDKIGGWQKAIGQATYNMGGALDSFEGFREFGLTIGRLPEEIAPFAKAMMWASGSADKAKSSTAELRAQAEKFGTIGGVAALADQYAKIGDMQGRILGGAGAMSGALAALGKGLDPRMAEGVQGTLLGSLAGDPQGWSRAIKTHMGDGAVKQTFDEYGRVRDPRQALITLREVYRKRYGQRARYMAGQEFGPAAAQSLFSADLDSTFGVAPADAKPSGFGSTAAGKREQATAAGARAMQGALDSQGTAGGLLDTYQNFAKSNPLLAKFLEPMAFGVLTKVGPGLLGGLLRGGTSLAAGVGGGSALTGAGILGGAALAGGVIGVGAGYGLDKLGVGDWASRDSKGGVNWFGRMGDWIAHAVGLADEPSIKAMDPSARLRLATDKAEAGGPGGVPSPQSDISKIAAEVKKGVAEALKAGGIQISIFNSSIGPIEAAVAGSSGRQG